MVAALPLLPDSAHIRQPGLVHLILVSVESSVIVLGIDIGPVLVVCRVAPSCIWQRWSTLLMVILPLPKVPTPPGVGSSFASGTSLLTLVTLSLVSVVLMVPMFDDLNPFVVPRCIWTRAVLWNPINILFLWQLWSWSLSASIPLRSRIVRVQRLSV